MFCLAVCKLLNVYGLILSITFDLLHCGISYVFSHVVSSDFYGKLLHFL